MIRKNLTRNRLAILLAVIFINTLLVKPLHIFTPCHSHCVSEKTESHHIPSAKHEDCGICHFSFSVFTPTQLTTFEASEYTLVGEIPAQEENPHVQEIKAHPSLRAPPIV